jgi:hypothetical protein
MINIMLIILYQGDFRLYKILYREVFGPFSCAVWDTSGTWMPDVGEPVICRTGYYGVPKSHLHYWMNGICGGYRDQAKFYTLYEIELGGQIKEWPDKSAGSTARIVRRLGNMEEFLESPELIRVVGMPYRLATYSCGHEYTVSSLEPAKKVCPYIHLNKNKIPDLEGATS